MDGTVRISIFIMCLLLIFLLSNNARGNSAFGNHIITIPNLFTYINSTYGIKMQFPSNWDVQEVGSTLNDPSITIVRFTPSFDIHRSFKTDPSDGNTYVDINLQKNIGNTSLDALMKNNINIIKNDKNTSNFRLLSSTTDTILAGRKAYTMVYSSTYNGLKTITMDSATIFGHGIYYTTFNAEPFSYAEYAQTARKMFESLRLMTT